MLYLSTSPSPFHGVVWHQPVRIQQVVPRVLVALGVSAMIRRKMPCLSWHIDKQCRGIKLKCLQHLGGLLIIWSDESMSTLLVSVLCILSLLALFFWYSYMAHLLFSPLSFSFPQGLKLNWIVLIGAARVLDAWSSDRTPSFSCSLNQHVFHT